MPRHIRPQVATRIHARITLLFAPHYWRESGNLKSHLPRWEEKCFRWMYFPSERRKPNESKQANQAYGLHVPGLDPPIGRLTRFRGSERSKATDHAHESARDRDDRV